MLYLVPTPIGNLGDITIRALNVLKEADFIACEDTRHTKKLLTHYEISTKLISFHEHSGKGKVEEIMKLLEKGSDVALVTDAGTPLISDPGYPLVREAIHSDIKIEALPGACAAVTALSVSGLAAESFTFRGFLPPKTAGRKKKFEELKECHDTHIFYESPYRVLKSLEDMLEVWGDREAVVARELTKKFEEVSRGTISDLVEKFSKKTPKGEFVILVAGYDRKKVF